MPTPSPSAKSPAELLAEARALLDQRPEAGEMAEYAIARLITAQWLIAEADWQRVSAALDAEQRPAYQAEPLTAERREQFAELAEDVRAGAHQRDETGRLTAADACPSRFLDPEGQRIVHCAVKHVDPLPTLHTAGGLSWGPHSAMPADRPCDHRCHQCVKRARAALVVAAGNWSDSMTAVAIVHRSEEEQKLIEAVHVYRKMSR